MIKKIIKRDGRVVDFDKSRITNAIFKAARAVGGWDLKESERLTEEIVKILEEKFKHRILKVEEVQDVVEKVLIEEGHAKTAKAYILYRAEHAHLRDFFNVLRDVSAVGDYLTQKDWMVRENSNMTYSLQGLAVHLNQKVISNYWMNSIYPSEIRQAHQQGKFHIHDLGTLGAYCMGWDLRDLMLYGFRGVRGKVESGPPKHLDVALLQIVNFLYTLQGESAGAQAFSNFDSMLAPFIRQDSLTYKKVKQELQKFLFNMNVPTRVGFQCISEDTEILTPDGWKTYDKVKKGDIIYTFNIKKHTLEKKPITGLFIREYKGKMYNLRNKTQNQLISPHHRVVRQVFNSNKYKLEPIEDILRLKSPISVPVVVKNTNPDLEISDEKLKLIAWILSEGSIEPNGSHRISIYQSQAAHPEAHNEIISLLGSFGLVFSDKLQYGWGECNHLRFNPSSSKAVHKWLEGKEKKFPASFLNLSRRQARLFLESYVKGDGWKEKYRTRIVTTDEKTLESLEALAVLAGLNFIVRKRKPQGASKKIQYILTLTKSKHDYIQTIKKINYVGKIWSVHTENETVIAKRRGQVFITGNTPFTNLTLDLVCPSYMVNEPVMIGGKPQDMAYGDFQKEMDLINRIFAELMIEGDSKNRPFTFPIPTYNITKKFDWENEQLGPIWEMTSKYGIPYFSNFIKSDMKPEDARSMCCRLRLDNRELRKRGGGLFGANPKTGSIGVVTINMPQLAYLSKNETLFFENLTNLMDLAKSSLIIKRKILEKFTESNLYPYSKFYLKEIREKEGTYWKNHFSTIGLIGMNDALLNLFGVSISHPEGRHFAERVLLFMREKLADYQQETGDIFNLEATPAEGACYRLALIDKKRYPRIRIWNLEKNKGKVQPYYTNSTQLPVDFTSNLFAALKLQEPLQTKYTGGTVFHAFLGSQILPATVKTLVKKIANNFALPYYTITPTFSICPTHGYLQGEHQTCPMCGLTCEVWSRSVGYLRPVEQWNDGKQQEFKDRAMFGTQPEIAISRAKERKL